MTRYAVDVDFVVDHDSLRRGRIVDGTHRVDVDAETATEAELIAAQMVAARAIPTATRRADV